MITIDEVKDWVRKYPENTPHGGMRLVCDLAISQHEEIERLRAALAEANSNHEHMVGEWKAAMREIESLQAANKDLQAWFDDLKYEFDKCRGWLKHHDNANPSLKAAISKAQDEAYERAAKVADGYRCGGCGMDGKCAKAIRALKTGEPK